MSEQTSKASRLPGHAADSPGSGPGSLAPGRFMERPDGMMAMGHASTMSHGVEVANYQTVTPQGDAVVTATYGDRAGPLAQAIGAHQVRVQSLDQASASGEHNLAQMGPRRPGGAEGIADRGDYRTAPTGAEVHQRPIVPPALEYRREPGQLQGGPA